MWILLMRAPSRDAAVWRGRKALAALDAVAWPLLCAWLLSRLPIHAGLVAPVGYAVLALMAAVRLRRALFMNESYWFTTWRWGKIAAAVLLIGCVLKLALLA